MIRKVNGLMGMHVAAIVLFFQDNKLSMKNFVKILFVKFGVT